MPYRQLRRNVDVGFGVAIAVLFLTGAAAVWSEVASARATERRIASFTRRSELTRLFSLLQDAETGQRGYLLTGLPSYVVPYDRASRAIGSQRSAVLSAFTGIPEEHADIEAIDSLTWLKLGELGGSITLRRDSGMAAALQRVQIGVGKSLMDDIRARVDRVIAHENSDIAIYDAQADSARRMALGAIAGAGLLAVLFITVAGVMVHRDFHRRAAVENALRDSENRLFRILDLMPIGVFVMDGAGKAYFANREAQRILGKGVDPRQTLDALPDVYQAYRTSTGQLYSARELPIARAIAGEANHVEDIEIRRPDGTVPIEVFAAPVYGADGSVAYAVAAFSDTTERRRTDQELRASQRFLDSVVESMPNMVFVKDAQTLRFVRFNRAGERLVGYPRSDLIGKNDADFFPPDEASAFMAKDREVLEHGEVVDIPEEPIHTRSNGVRFLHTRKVPIVDEAGKPKYLLGVSEDITEAKEAEKLLRRAQEQAETANHAKSEFLAKMSHELRTPLNAIIGFSEVLQDEAFGPLTDKQQRYVRNVLTSGRQLLDLVNDVLDLSKVEAGRMELTIEKVDLIEALEEARGLVAPLAERKRITLNMDVESTLPFLHADPIRLRQILFNLLSNAIKYTPEGGRVTLGGCRPRTAVQGREGWIEIFVHDTGIGIEPQDQERIFGEFEQVQAGYVREQQGTGLGLALTRRLVALHGGVVTVESALGRGSTFRVLLPPRSAAGYGLPASGVAPGGPRGGPLVLVVDDHPEAADLLTHYLQEAGYRVAVASSGEAAVGLARALRPHAITLDVLLPDRDGISVLTELKADPVTREIPVIVVSIDDKARGFSLGVAEWFVKPVARDDLIAALQRHVNAVRGAPLVLVVDDNPADVELMERYLVTAGYRVSTAGDGTTGVQRVLEERPDAVVLDLVMPGVTGFDVVRELRRDTAARDIPILICTGKDLNASDRAKLRGSVQAIVSKGLRDQLLAELARIAPLAASA